MTELIQQEISDTKKRSSLHLDTLFEWGPDSSGNFIDTCKAEQVLKRFIPIGINLGYYIKNCYYQMVLIKARMK